MESPSDGGGDGKAPGTPRFGQTSQIASPLVRQPPTHDTQSNRPSQSPSKLKLQQGALSSHNGNSSSGSKSGRNSSSSSIFIQRKPHTQPFKPGRAPIDTTAVHGSNEQGHSHSQARGQDQRQAQSHSQSRSQSQTQSQSRSHQQGQSQAPDHFAPLPVNSDAWKQRTQLPSFKRYPSGVSATPGRTSGPADWVRTPLQPPSAAPANFSPEWTRGNKPYRPPQPPPMFSLGSRELGKQSAAARYGKSPVRQPAMQHGAPRLETLAEPHVDPGKATENLKSFLDAFVGEQDADSSSSDTSSSDEEDDAVARPKAVPARKQDPAVVPGLKCKLLPHQIKGLRFLQSREAGKLKNGGLLADDMGLGKTVQTIALIATCPRPQELHEKCIRTTLVVAPLALIEQWAGEIRSKTEDLTVYVHHGPSRLRNARSFGSYDVVVTTYNILTQEHSGERDGCVPDGVDDGAIYDERGVFGVRWWRVVLDEAHTVKNRSAKMTQAAYALRAVKRWCLTGTPIQNAADDLQSLLKFMRVSPADAHPWWKQKISEPIARGNVNTAMKRLHVILSGIMLRRTKQVLMSVNTPSGGGYDDGERDKDKEHRLVLPPRKTRHLYVDFTPQEREFYDGLEQRADKALDRMKQSGAGVGYMSVLVLLQRLRQACNHAQLVTKEMDISEYRPSPMSPKKKTARDKQQQVQELDDLAALLGGVKVDDDGAAGAGAGAGSPQRVMTCSICLADVLEGTRPSPGSRSRQVTCDACRAAVEKFDDGARADKGTKYLDMSAKMRRLLDLLLDEYDDDDDDDDDDDNESNETKHNDNPTPPTALDKARLSMPATRHRPPRGPPRKTIVFSQWTSMLQVIGPFLAHAGITFALYHGGMSVGERERSLGLLRSGGVSVLLTSLKCGALGLNLVAASRVVLVDPWWNPAVEDQAIDRVHRIGQTAKDVRVYRITVNNTVEARITQLQQTKRALAQNALAPGNRDSKGVTLKRDAKLGLDELLKLFAHD